MPPKENRDNGDDPGSLDDLVPCTTRSKNKKARHHAGDDTDPLPHVPRANEGQDSPEPGAEPQGNTRSIDGVRNGIESQRRNLAERIRRAEQAAEIPGFRKYEIKDKRLRQLPIAKRRAQITALNRRVGGGKKFYTMNRRAAHDKRDEQFSLYEDFLYYQAPRRRKEYTADRNRKRVPKWAPFARGQLPGLLTNDEAYNVKLGPIIQSFERDQVGLEEELESQDMGPEILHRRIPAQKHFHVGLGKEHPPPLNRRADLNLNHEAIEERRRAVENENLDSTRMEESHSERRKRETEALGPHLPDDIYVHSKISTARDLGRTRLESGLFVSAGESSSDWNTSYDQLDIIVPGRIANVVSRPTEEASELNEFCRSPVLPTVYDPRKEDDHIEVTPWAETSYGRREYHIHQELEPYSPVESPPHSPIYPKAIPGGRVHVPVDVPQDHDLYNHYRRKFQDHFGVRFRNWPEFEGKPQGTGFEIAYEPSDVAALPIKQQARYRAQGEPIMVGGRYALPAPEGTSMRLLREALNEPYRPPIWTKVPDNGEDSDDEGDLFAQSYRQCSEVCSRLDLSVAAGEINNAAEETKAPQYAIALLFERSTTMTKQRDYAQYSRTQIRDAFRRLGINQNAPTNRHLYQRAQDWDKFHEPDSVNSYILSKVEAENNMANFQHKKKPKGLKKSEMRGTEQQVAATPEDDGGLCSNLESTIERKNACREHTGAGRLVAEIRGDGDDRAIIGPTSQLVESKPAQRSQTKQKASSPVDFSKTWAFDSNNDVALSADDGYETQTDEQTIAGFEPSNRYDLRHSAKTREIIGTFHGAKATTKSTVGFSGSDVKSDESYDALEDASASVKYIPKTNSRSTLWSKFPHSRESASTFELPEKSASNKAIQATSDTFEYAVNNGAKRKCAIDLPASNKQLKIKKPASRQQEIAHKNFDTALVHGTRPKKLLSADLLTPGPFHMDSDDAESMSQPRHSETRSALIKGSSTGEYIPLADFKKERKLMLQVEIVASSSCVGPVRNTATKSKRHKPFSRHSSRKNNSASEPAPESNLNQKIDDYEANLREIRKKEYAFIKADKIRRKKEREEEAFMT
ncbi:hypothetical protein DDE82_001552 [Stemphylium lycopersici]|nr:hypothetical protein DDE82_001552 [Stemphylium lycopersici]